MSRNSSALSVSRRSHPVWLVRFSALFALFFWTVELGSFAHEAFAVHVRCAAHDEAMHVSSAAADPRAPSVVHNEAAASQGRDAGVNESHEHDHCSIVAPSSNARTEQTQIAKHESVAERQIDCLLVTCAVPPQIALLDVAPKGSPPVAS